MLNAFVVQGDETFSDTRSISNDQEANAVTQLVTAFLDAREVVQTDIGVITPYEAQTSLIKRKLATAGKSSSPSGLGPYFHRIP